MKNVIFLFCALIGIALANNSFASADARKDTLTEASVSNQTQVSLAKLSAQNLSTFNEAFSVLAEVYNASFVCEGSPIHSQLSSEQAEQLVLAVKRAVERKKTASDIVDLVANAYDYTVAVRPFENLFVLEKRYSSPQDLPSLTFTECVRALEAIEHALRPYCHTSRLEANDELIAKIPELLSPQEVTPIADLKPARRGMEKLDVWNAYVPIERMNQKQRDLLFRVAQTNFFRSRLADTTIIGHYLTAINKRGAKFKYQTHKNTGNRLWGMEVQLRPESPWFVPLSHTNHINLVEAEETGIWGIPSRPNLDDPTVPEASPEAKSANALKREGLQETLASWVKRYNESRKAMEPVVELEEGLDTKEVTLVAQNKASGARMLSAMARIYGLTVVSKQSENGKPAILRLTWQPIKRVRNASEIPDFVQSVLPPPLRRCLQPTDGAPATSTPGSFVAAKKSLQHATAWGRRPYAVRRLRELVEPRMNQPPPTLPFVEWTDVSTEEKDRLAVVLVMQGAVNWLQMGTMYPYPKTLADFDKAVIQLVLQRGEPDSQEVHMGVVIPGCIITGFPYTGTLANLPPLPRNEP